MPFPSPPRSPASQCSSLTDAGSHGSCTPGPLPPRGCSKPPCLHRLPFHTHPVTLIVCLSHLYLSRSEIVLPLSPPLQSQLCEGQTGFPVQHCISVPRVGPALSRRSISALCWCVGMNGRLQEVQLEPCDTALPRGQERHFLVLRCLEAAVVPGSQLSDPYLAPDCLTFSLDS